MSTQSAATLASAERGLPMRIAYVTNSTEGGGAALPIPAVTAVLRELGAEVRVFALERRDGHALPSLLAAGLDPLVRPGGTKKDHLAALRWLDSEVRAWGATHLWTALSRASALGLVLARRHNIPTYCWLMNSLPTKGNRWILRALQSRAKTWVAVSDSTAELARKVLRVENSRLLVWPTFAANPSAPRARPWRPGETLRIGSLGRLHPVKGYDVLVAALARLTRAGFRPPVPFVLTIAGEGAQRDALEAQAREAGLSELLLPGYTQNPQQFLAGLHLYVQPSRSEGICVAAHEAMVAGLPVLASSVGELSATIQDENTGILVPPGSPDALAAALHYLLSEPERLEYMGNGSRQRVLNLYSEQRFRDAGAELFRRMSAASVARRTATRDRSGPRA